MPHRFLAAAVLAGPWLLLPGAVLAQAPGPAPAAAAGETRVAEIRIVASRPGRKVRQSIALPAPRLRTVRADPVLERAAEELREVLWEDLRTSGVFEMVPRERYAGLPPTTPETVPYDEWNAIGTAFLALLDVSAEGPEVVLEGRLFETRTDRKMILGKRYQARPELARRMAHTFADAVIETVGGEPGVCRTELAFVSDRDDRRSREIYLMDYDGHGQRRVSANRRLNLSPDWSPDNESIVYTSYIRNNPDLYILSRSGGTNRVLFAEPGMNSSPAWAPDGKLIVFASSYEGGDTEIYTIRPDGSGMRRLTRNRGIDTNPAWSPSGREIVFTSDRAGRPDLWQMDGEGLNLRRMLTQGMFNDGGAWAPAGRGSRLALAGMSGGSFQIYVYVVETGELVQLTDTGSNEAPTWSPDGRQIAFASTRGGKTDIYVMNDDGENLRRITSEGNNLSPDWSNR